MKAEFDDIEYLRNKIEDENIKAPDSISEDEMLGKIGNFQPARKNKKRLKIVFGSISATAVVAVALAAVTVINNMQTVSTAEKRPAVSRPTSSVVSEQDSAPDFTMKPYGSYDEIKSLFADIDKLHKSNIALTYGYNAEFAEDFSGAETKANGGFSAKTTTDTYLQVENVDEADVIKNDGKNIYRLCQQDSTVTVYAPKEANANPVAVIDDYKSDSTANMRDIYVSGGKLILLGTEYRQSGMEADCVAAIYDVTDAEHPKREKELVQSGCYTTSRLINGQLYTLSQYSVYDDNNCFPSSGSYNQLKNLPCDCIYGCRDPKAKQYLVISQSDIMTAEQKDVKALLGASQDVYCNMNNMYAVSYNYPYFFVEDGLYSDTVEKIKSPTTEIVKISLDDGVHFACSGEVSGSVVNQFSMDEYNGYFRIATTDANEKGKSQNNIFVLDGNLKQVGSLTGFAEDENIKAVRFMGNTAYVITYKQIDPLFVIDMTDAEHPKIKGSVEITGFSSMLVPISDDRLLGIGCSTAEAEWGETVDGLKLVLFSVSDPEKPSVLSTWEMSDAYSNAQSEHKALLVNKEKQCFAIPFYCTENNTTGGIAFSVENDEIKILDEFVSFKNDDYIGQIDRLACIGDYVYAFSSTGKVYPEKLF